MDTLNPRDPKATHAATAWTAVNRLIATAASSGRNVEQTLCVNAISGAALSLTATLTVARSFTLPDADLDLSQVTNGVTGSDTRLVTGTAGDENRTARWDANGDLIEGSLHDNGTALYPDGSLDLGTAGSPYGDGYLTSITVGGAIEVSSSADEADALLFNANGDRVLELKSDAFGNGKISIRDTDGEPAIELTGSGSTPLELYRDSTGAGPHVKFDMKNDADAYHSYADIYAAVDDDTDGSEEGELRLQASVSGSLAVIAKVHASGIELLSGYGLTNAGGTPDIGTAADPFGDGYFTSLYVDGTELGDPDTIAYLDNPQTFTAGQRSEVTTLTDGANISIDLDDSNNFEVTLGGNRQLDNPSNAEAGQSGFITVTQDGTGSRTLSYDTQYVFTGGVTPILTTDPDAVDVLTYYVIDSTTILLQLISDVQ